jgi:hypothetical protein
MGKEGNKMKCYACGFADPENKDGGEPRFVEISLNGDYVFQKREYRKAEEGAHGNFAAGWWGLGRADIFACPECGTLKIKGSKDD